METLFLAIGSIFCAIIFLAVVSKAGQKESGGDFKSMWTWGGIAVVILFIFFVFV